MSDVPELNSFPNGGAAVILGASGAIGDAIAKRVEESHRFEKLLRFSRSAGEIRLDLLDEDSIAACARSCVDAGVPVRLVFDATGILHGPGMTPEKSIRRLSLEAMAQSFAINATGPALLMKHFLPLLAKDGKSVFATLSAKVGSIGDNRLGGWYSYRASKAALNQIVRTASVELARTHREAICVALHPGTVESPLSAPFSKSGLKVRSPDIAASELLRVIDALDSSQTGGFFDYKGDSLPW